MLPIGIGVIFILVLTSVLYFNPASIERARRHIKNIFYDIRLRYEYKPVQEDTAVAIVDIDDESLAVHGRWPWSRQKLGKLVTNLFQKGAKVIAIDLIFSEPERNIVEELIREMNKSGWDNTISLSKLDSMKGSFDRDAAFAKDLQSGMSVLSYVLTNEGAPIGSLPPPSTVLSPALEKELYVPNYKSYLANIPILSNAARGQGFINSAPDWDGIIRTSPLVQRIGPNLYSSLALEAVKWVLGESNIQLITEKYGNTEVLEGVKLGSRFIPTDPWGNILIPFRGPPFSVPYISSKDVLNMEVPKESIAGKLIFIGSSATALGDLVATSISPIFSGVEIHAHIAAGIIDGYLPYWPEWSKGLSILMVLVLGLICAVLFPIIGAIGSIIIVLVLCSSLIYFDHWVWATHGIIFSSVIPIIVILFLYTLSQIIGYLFESHRRREMKEVFGQYVPPEYIDSMMSMGEEIALEGETKNLSVLFADIRSFTKISEKMKATDLKHYLNDFLSPMTEVIFEQKGTIDKYIGDLIMAFWGAPLEDEKHATHAVRSGLLMQKKLIELNDQLKKENKPEIQIGVGINTGEMNVGDMGSKFRRAYTVLGDAVNLGSRLESITKLYHVKILVTASSYEATKDEFVYQKIDRVQVKGKGEAVDIYEPICLKEEASQDLISRVDKHHKGFQAYVEKKWDEAEKIFNELKETSNKELYELYLSRIEEYKSNPPEEGWDGTHILESK
jgi:adenylate cyclase